MSIQQRGNMLDVTIDGKHQLVPRCTCGKCIVRRLRKDFFASIPYGDNLGTTYKDDYDWKEKGPEGPYYNRSKHNSFEGAYREPLPTSLLSTMKKDFKPFKVKEEIQRPDEEVPYKIPFQGRSTYKRQYPDWGAMAPVPDTEDDKIPEIVVPLRGESNYKESYPFHDPNNYLRGEHPDVAKPTLKFNGELDPRTTYKEHYKPIKGFPEEPLINTAKGENPAMIPAPNAPGILGTTYRKDYIKYEDMMCLLRKWLNARGMRYLVI